MIRFGVAGQQFETERLIGDRRGLSGGPTLVFVAGIHGNEPSGVIALQRVFQDLDRREVSLQGRLLGLVGNLEALAQHRRYLSRDLNRIWDQDFSRQYYDATQRAPGLPEEFREATEIFDVIEPLLKRYSQSLGDPANHSKLYFVDLHTTSAPTVPFIAINDQLDNRNFALQFPVPTVLGIEEYLQGPLLSYLNDFGPVAMAFEAGQHDDPKSIDVHVAFIYLAMLAAGIVRAEQIPDLVQHRRLLQDCGGEQQGIVEVVYRRGLALDDNFVMEPGFTNFHPIQKGALLAQDRRGPIRADRAGQIFMPLYQAVGEDGFFIVRKVPRWALLLSSLLRRVNFETILTLLPGISRSQLQPEALVVDRRIARFLAVQLFHLLGYRRKRDDGNVMIVSRREIQRT